MSARAGRRLFHFSATSSVRSTTTSIHFAQNAPGSLPLPRVCTISVRYAPKCSGEEVRKVRRAHYCCRPCRV